MYIYTRTLLLLFFLMAVTVVQGQDQIERLFRSDRQNAGIDVGQTSDMGYLILSAGRSLDSTRFEFYTVSKFDNKGNLSWSKDYDFAQKVEPNGSLIVLEDDGFVLSGILDTNSTKQVLLRGDLSGEPVWTKRFGRDSIQTNSFEDATVDQNDLGNFYLSANVEGDIHLAEVNADGNQLWARNYFEATKSFVGATVRTTQDSGAIICGTVLQLGLIANFYAVKTDSTGAIEWAREYGEDNLSEYGTAVLPTTDGGYLFGASKLNPLLPSHPGLLVKTDTFGNTQWVYNVDFQTSDTIIITDMIMANDGNVVVSGRLLGINDETFAWMMKISLNGEMIWKRRYKASTRQNIYADGLTESPAGGYVYLTTSDEGTTQAGPYLIKTLDDGTTICDSIIDGQLIFPVDSVKMDTLILTTSDLTDARDITLTDTLNYGGFIITTVTLETFGPYCPAEVFSDTLDATTDGATAYEWSTGEETATIVVTEPGEYMVTVTIGEDYCYQLCTSTTISELPLPEIMLDFSDGTFCTTGTVTIITEDTAVESFAWSTGETSDNIIVDTEGTYSVTVTNVCGTAEDDINIVFNTDAPEVTLVTQGNFCTDGAEVITAETSFLVNGFLWSTGEETTSITIDALGTYAVTALSNFCDDGMAQYVAQASNLTVDISRDTGLCTTGTELLVANTEAINYSWSNGGTTPSIQVSQEGDYSVTVSDFCSESTADISVTCPLIYDIPNVFTPADNEFNNVFLPVFAFNPASLVEYEFIVYSRWGEIVFETNNPTDGWDGTVNDGDGASDVYFYKVSGTNNLGVSIEHSGGMANHGDITLLR